MNKNFDINPEQATILLNSVAFQDTIATIRNIQVNIFLNPGSTLEVREDAHQINKALGKIESMLKTVVAEEERKRNK